MSPVETDHIGISFTNFNMKQQREKKLSIQHIGSMRENQTNEALLQEKHCVATDPCTLELLFAELESESKSEWKRWKTGVGTWSREAKSGVGVEKLESLIVFFFNHSLML